MIHIDSRSSKPIYEQIIDEIKENIIKGILLEGDKLLSVRELSSLISVNPNTVAKAYKELERENAIEVIRGKGTFVKCNYKPRLDKDKLEQLVKQFKKLVIETHYMGMGKEQVIDILENIYEELERK